jgi:capsule polysaccharide export protein KpsE/RkpR
MATYSGYSNLQKTEIDAVEADIVTLQGEMNDVEADVVTLQGEMTSVENSIVANDTRIDNANGNFNVLATNIDLIVDFLKIFNSTYTVKNASDETVVTDWDAIITAVGGLDDIATA